MSIEKKAKRLQIDISPDSEDKLNFLKENTECSSFKEVTGRSYSIYHRLVIAQQQGCEIIIRDPKTGKESILII